MDNLTPVRIRPLLLAVSLALIIWFAIPVPDGVSSNAWQLLALFIGTIAAIIGKAMPIGAISVVAIMLVAITGVTQPNKPAAALNDALSGFSNSLIWLIGLSIMLSQSLLKTGLGARIGYRFISLFGKRTLGIAWALALAETVIAPVTPSNTARGGGIIHPIMRAIADSLGSKPCDVANGSTGRYLALVNYNTNPITSAMFITATAPNPLVVNLLTQGSDGVVNMTWGMWAIAALLPALVSLFIMPLVIWWLYPPSIRQTPDSPKFARQKLDQLGPLSRAEKITLGVFILLLCLWADVLALMLGENWQLNPTTAALVGLSILLLSGVLSWEDILKCRGAWDTIVWFAALVMMASFLSKLGLVSWLAVSVQGAIEHLGLHWSTATLLLILIYVYSHYFFASTTAHITAMFAAFFAAGLALGAPPALLGLMLGFASSLMMSLTHYGTGTAPIIFGSGYVTLADWWKTGLVISAVNLLIWGIVGGWWWRILGYW
ncbi:DASS family sodium-coupled anion symporter [Cedecea neteri]|uniref:DASS family sodium-coupled anion symporter n=1 Tax=Cedecea neteri TaxID=158822 RepID=UPI00289AEA6E|nr:DASS family sodium-coupled anion symporter [Cedecea neteri]